MIYRSSVTPCIDTETLSYSHIAKEPRSYLQYVQRIGVIPMSLCIPNYSHIFIESWSHSHIPTVSWSYSHIFTEDFSPHIYGNQYCNYSSSQFWMIPISLQNLGVIPISLQEFSPTYLRKPIIILLPKSG